MSGIPQSGGDAPARRGFIEQAERSVTVVAPAGVGKTRELVSRIVEIARRPNAAERLPRLVVVTYTRRAAAEMRQRARAKLAEANLPMAAQEAMGRAFFGTIHSFCAKLLRRHGHCLGVPSALRAVEDLQPLWHRFVQQLDSLGLPEAWGKPLLRLVRMGDILAVASQMAGAPEEVSDPGPPPPLEMGGLLGYVAPARSRGPITRSQDAARRFAEEWRKSDGFARWPSFASTKEAGFPALWRQELGPLRTWIRTAILAGAGRVAGRFQEFRIAEGALTYDDLVELAARLLDHAEAGAALRAERFEVMLDEAQDTDPLQFRLLTGLSDWQRGPETLTMVGDPQQSIYRQRADLETYRGIHRGIAAAPAGGEAVFKITFRCARQVVGFVNAAMPALLSGDGGQVEFVALEAREGADRGQVVRWDVEPPAAGAEARWSQARRREHVARAVARRVAAAGFAGLGARGWAEVAMLCPRRRWFGPLERALREEGVPVSAQGFRQVGADDPLLAWTAALSWAVAHPMDGFEIVGILREIYGIPDGSLAAWARGNGAKWRIDLGAGGPGEIGAALRHLAEVRREAVERPLGEGVEWMMRRTALGERLAGLGLASRADIDATRRKILLAAAVAEDRGACFADWADEMREMALAPLESDDGSARPDGINILTCQKAKGLEWDAVIVPYLFQPIFDMKPPYPRLVGRPKPAVPEVLLDRGDRMFLGEAEEREDQAARQEWDRILYVTLTRARSTLVLAGDAGCWAGAKSGGMPSFGERLTAGAAAVWEALPRELDPALADESRRVRPAQDGLPKMAAGGAVPPAALPVPDAAERAGRILRRVTPHRLAHSEAASEVDAREERWADEAGLQEKAKAYGIWWHALMEVMPWAEGEPAWRAWHAKQLRDAPDAPRAEKDWERLLGSGLPRRLGAPSMRCKAEVPFLWRKDDATVLEGVIDLVAHDSSTEEWWLIDWKTNRAGPDGLAELASRYGGQLRAYVEAWQGLYGGKARALLYSTELGEWVEVTEGG